MKRLAIAVVAVACLTCSSCALRDDESKRPPPKPVNVLDDLQAQADTHPLAGWSQ